MGKEKVLTKKQIQRNQLNKVLDYNESELVAMQGQGWVNLSFDQLNILENFVAVAIGTMRSCPPSYVRVASSNVIVRAKLDGKETQVIDIGKPLKVEPLTGTGIADNIHYPNETGNGIDAVAEDVKP